MTTSEQELTQFGGLENQQIRTPIEYGAQKDLVLSCKLSTYPATIQLTYLLNDHFASRRIHLKGTGYYKGQSDPNLSIGFPQDFKEILRDRFLDLAICRFLQVNRQIDIVSFMAFIKGTETARRSVAGKISIYKQAGAIDGEVKGKDESGYPYKLWKIINPDKIKPILKKKHISPLQQDTLEILRVRTNSVLTF